MHRGNRLLLILALSVVPMTAGLATQPAATQGTKAGSDAHYAQRPSKPGVDAQKKTEIPPGTSGQWRRINAARAKQGVEARQGKVPDAGPGGARNIAVTTGITRPARPHGTSPAAGAVGARNAASISGTDMRLKGTTPAVIHPGGKYGARITGGAEGKNWRENDGHGHGRKESLFRSHPAHPAAPSIEWTALNGRIAVA
jgi:hypothetical protein